MTQGINNASVTKWIHEVIPDLEPPLEFDLIAGGHSNLTYRFTDRNDRSFVLRRPPLGHVLESAHDMGREYRIISALQDTGVPVPKTYGLCQGGVVNEVPFYVMSFVEGIVPHSSIPLQSMSMQDRWSFGTHAIEVLASLHTINPDDVGLGQLGRKEAYLDRQLKLWTQQWSATKTHEITDMDESLRLLHEKKPEQIGSAIVPRRLSTRKYAHLEWQDLGIARLGVVYTRRSVGRYRVSTKQLGRTR